MSSRLQTLITYATALSTAVVGAGAFTPTIHTHTNTNINYSIRRKNPSFISSPTRSRPLYASAAAYPEGPNDWDDKRSSAAGQSNKSTSSSSSEDDLESTSPEFTTNFLPLESHPPSPQRLSRIEQEAKNKSKFLHGDELVELRKYMTNLKLDLQMAKEKRDNSRIRDLTKALHESQNLDAEHVYTHCMEMAEGSSSEEEKMEWIQEANEAKECLPQFNLQGLWVGK